MRLIAFRAEYAAVRVLDAVLCLLPWRAASALGAAAGGAARLLLRRRWELTLRNLEAAFPEKPREDRERIAREAWRNTGRMLTELLKARHLSREALAGVVRFEGLELYEGLLAEGKGFLLNAGHLGSWEAANLALTAAGYPLAAVGRNLKNPFVDAWLTESRSRFGFLVIKHKNPFLPAARWLREGKPLGVLIDHNIRKGGVFIPFFGRPAATSTLSALLAVRLGCPILTARARREGRWIVASFHGPLRPDPAADPDQEVRRLTTAMVSQLEAFVRERPGDWLWGHNRWRRTPEGEAVSA